MLSLALAPALAVSACGPSSDNNANAPGDSDSPGACQDRASTGSVTQVDLRVNSPLPSVFTANCPHSAVSTLKAYLLDAVPNAACELAVASTGVTGCCEGVPADQNPWLTLVYRETVLNLYLAEQGKMVLLPSTSPPVVDVSFSSAPVDRPYDTDGDLVDNLAEWCAGTLSY